MSKKSDADLHVKIKNDSGELSHVLLKSPDGGEHSVIEIALYKDSLGFATPLIDLPTFPGRNNIGLRENKEKASELGKLIPDHLKPALVYELEGSGFFIAFVDGKCFSGTFDQIIGAIKATFSTPEDSLDSNEQPESESTPSTEINENLTGDLGNRSPRSFRR